MEPKVNYMVVGLFVVVLTTALVAGLIWFTAAEHKPHRTYLVYMNEAATGLAIAATVKFNGVDVGYVKDIRLNPANPQQVILELSIETDAPINQSTTATLMMQGITGVSYVGLSAKAAFASPIAIKPGEHYPEIPYTPSLLVQLNNVLSDIGAGMKGLREAFEGLLNEKNRKNIAKSLGKYRAIHRHPGEKFAAIRPNFQRHCDHFAQHAGSDESGFTGNHPQLQSILKPTWQYHDEYRTTQ